MPVFWTLLSSPGGGRILVPLKAGQGLLPLLAATAGVEGGRPKALTEGALRIETPVTPGKFAMKSADASDERDVAMALAAGTVVAVME